MTTIATNRLLLRPLRSGDEEALIRGLNNFNVSQWTARIPFPYTLADAADFLSVCGAPGQGTLHRAISHQGALVGGISYEAKGKAQSAEIGYWIAEPHWGRGFGKEAARAMVEHAFAAAGHLLLLAGYRHGNEASRRILQGLGFVKTGDAMMFSKAVGAETPTARLELRREVWLGKGGPTK